jgi:hypothetical protein
LLLRVDPSYVRFGSSTSFQAQAAHFHFSPDSGRIAASHRSATNRLTHDEARQMNFAWQLCRVAKINEAKKSLDAFCIL